METEEEDTQLDFAQHIDALEERARALRADLRQECELLERDKLLLSDAYRALHTERRLLFESGEKKLNAMTVEVQNVSEMMLFEMDDGVAMEEVLRETIETAVSASQHERTSVLLRRAADACKAHCEKYFLQRTDFEETQRVLEAKRAQAAALRMRLNDLARGQWPIESAKYTKMIADVDDETAAAQREAKELLEESMRCEREALAVEGSDALRANRVSAADVRQSVDELRAELRKASAQSTALEQQLRAARAKRDQ